MKWNEMISNGFCSAHENSGWKKERYTLSIDEQNQTTNRNSQWNLWLSLKNC